MKTVLAIMVSLSLCVGASAQRRVGGVSHYYVAPHYVAPRVVVAPSVGFGLGYGYGFGYAAFGLGYGYPFFGYPYLNYPVPYYGYRGGYGYNSSQLSLKIQSIKLDYQNQIRTTRHNKSLSHAERRAEIRNLKNERDQAIITAQQNFRNGRMNYMNRGQNNNYQNGNQNNQNNQNNGSVSPSSQTNS